MHNAGKETIGQTPTGGNGHGSQFDLPTNIPQGKNISRTGILEIVGLNVGFPCHQRYTGLVQIEGFGLLGWDAIRVTPLSIFSNIPLDHSCYSKNSLVWQNGFKEGPPFWWDGRDGKL
jgi:hypothetical protein